jgi:hypothetical protein
VIFPAGKRRRDLARARQAAASPSWPQRSVMSFWIEFLKGGDIVDSTFWRGDLASARMSAIDGFEVRKKQIDATFVRVIDVKRHISNIAANMLWRIASTRPRKPKSLHKSMWCGRRESNPYDHKVEGF